jgi:putative Mn2+ efflux pump MntP
VSFFELLVLSAALGTDLFSVAVPIGMNRIKLHVILKAAVVFALFHIVMILTGYNAGHWLGAVVEHVGAYHIDYPLLLVQNWASGIGAAVLTGLGLHMIKENLSPAGAETSSAGMLEGLSLAVLAVSVSVDALAAGFSLGMMDVDLIKLSIILGVVIFMIAVAGLVLGRRIGRYVGSRCELIGGLALLVLGLHILYTIFLG